MSIWQTICRVFSRKPDPLVEMVRTLNQRRRQDHYVFVHHALRQLAFGDPVGCFTVLSSDRADEAIADICRRVQESCATPEPNPRRLMPRDIHAHTTGIGQFPCIVVEMPEPTSETEAYFVAIVLLTTIDEVLDGTISRDTHMRYITLEKGMVDDGSSCNLVCEWFKEGMHAILGGGVQPNMEQFTQAVHQQLQSTKQTE
ncbi:MAG: hypothetical protein K8T25_12780 [Planctomycetia bacterium]|nr:hypothetical protein [Planctomycetia bacterium]